MEYRNTNSECDNWIIPTKAGTGGDNEMQEWPHSPKKNPVRHHRTGHYREVSAGGIFILPASYFILQINNPCHPYQERHRHVHGVLLSWVCRQLRTR